MNPRITRATNAKKRPGQVVIDSNRTRRSNAVVQAERTSKAAEQEKLATAQEEGIKDVARIEKDARKKDPEPDGQNKVTIPRVTRARLPVATTPSPVNQGKL
jgi:hypothetical protein